MAGSIAHARGLLEAGLLTKAGFNRVHRGLVQVGKEIESGQFVFADSDEDIHTAVERRLTEIDPDGAGRLHAGRSRNDQVALDLRLYCRAAASAIAEELARLVKALAESAGAHHALAMPGYTPLQRAQPVTVGHHLLAHAHPLLRDSTRVMSAYQAASEMPLGSGALAGTTLPLQRMAVADALGFGRLTRNSMDAVADRDFALDLVYACLSIGLHLSRLGEDVVLWASSEFGFLRLADEVSTGSSIMPQKRNPDIAELIRGRSGRALASLVGLATVLKGLPLAYDRDLQEDKEPVFDTVEQLLMLLPAVSGMIATLGIERERLTAAAPAGFALATDVAEWLVGKGVAFRDAHEISGSFVSYCEQRGLDLPDLTDAQLAEVDPQLTPEVRGVLSVEGALRARSSVGGTAPARVAEQSAQLIDTVHAQVAWANAKPGS